MLKKSKYMAVQGLEEQLKVAYNDIDLGLKLLGEGYNNIFLPQIEVMHHESKSRGLDITKEKSERLQVEAQYMYKNGKMNFLMIVFIILIIVIKQ
jgi:GT2 family glycosyltransferase